MSGDLMVLGDTYVATYPLTGYVSTLYRMSSYIRLANQRAFSSHILVIDLRSIMNLVADIKTLVFILKR